MIRQRAGRTRRSPRSRGLLWPALRRRPLRSSRDGGRRAASVRRRSIRRPGSDCSRSRCLTCRAWSRPSRRRWRRGFRRSMTALANRSADASDLARAYGETGQAADGSDALDAAEPAFSTRRRWRRTTAAGRTTSDTSTRAKGPLEKSVASFEKALQLAPDDVPTLVWLGDAYLAAGTRRCRGSAVREGDGAAARIGCGAVRRRPRGAAEGEDYARRRSARPRR